MPPLLAGLVVLFLGLMCLRIYVHADARVMAKLVRSTGAILFGLLALGLLIAGRAAGAVVSAAIAWALYTKGPFPWQRYAPGGGAGDARTPPSRQSAMSRKEALDILGLKEGASEDEIKAAHRRLILQTHPDKGGSDYLAAKINQAKDILLG